MFALLPHSDHFVRAVFVILFSVRIKSPYFMRTKQSPRRRGRGGVAPTTPPTPIFFLGRGVRLPCSQILGTQSWSPKNFLDASRLHSKKNLVWFCGQKQPNIVWAAIEIGLCEKKYDLIPNLVKKIRKIRFF